MKTMIEKIKYIIKRVKEKKYSFMAKFSFTNRLLHNSYWGSMFNFLLKNKSDSMMVTWSDLNKFEANYPEEYVYTLNKTSYTSNFTEYYDQKYKDIIIFLNSINNLNDKLFIELGSGWGRNLIYLNSIFPKLKFIGGDLSSQGIKTTNLFSKKFDLNISGIPFNYLNHKKFINKISNFESEFIIYSSFSIEQVANLNKEFFYDLINLNNKITAFHIEPISFQIEDREFPFNDHYNKHYNKNFYSILKELENEKLIKILFIKTYSFGHANNITGQESCIISWEKI